jgi:hypothetical protein
VPLSVAAAPVVLGGVLFDRSRVAARLEGAPVNFGGATLAHDGRMSGRDVADVRREAVVRIQRGEPAHRPVADDLGHDRCCGDGGALLVPVHDGAVLRRAGTETKAVHKADLGRRRQLPQDRAHRGEVRAMEAVRVDLTRRDRTDGNPLGTSDDGPKQRLPRRAGQLLRIVEQRERADTVVPQAGVVEQDARDDERSSERASARLVRPCDKPRAEAAVKR